MEDTGQGRSPQRAELGSAQGTWSAARADGPTEACPGAQHGFLLSPDGESFLHLSCPSSRQFRGEGYRQPGLPVLAPKPKHCKDPHRKWMVSRISGLWTESRSWRDLGALFFEEGVHLFYVWAERCNSTWRPEELTGKVW